MSSLNMLAKSAAALAMALALATPVMAQAPSETRTLRIVPFSDLPSIDPINTTAGNVQSHAMHVYDFLFGRDDAQVVKPQMVESWTNSEDGLTWRFTLRDGLAFHDGAAVTSEDVIQSLKRWGARDPYGRQLVALTKEMVANDAKSFTWVLTQPYALMLEALSKSTSNAPAIMPKRIAEMDPTKNITDPTGSGPFRFVQAEWVPGAKIVYARNEAYKPRPEPASGTAGGKVAKVDRIEWVIMPDGQSAVAALAKGEVDFLENPPTDLHPLIKRRGQVLTTTNKLGFQGMMRMNHLHPPFSDVRARRALLYLVDQKSYLGVMFGDPEFFRECRAFFVCGAPFATDAGAEPTFGKDKAKAKALLEEAGYKGEPIVILHPTDISFLSAATQYLAQDLRSIGVNVDLQTMDFATMSQRRASKNLPAQGGWHIGLTWWNGIGSSDPVGNVPMQASCDRAWPGWPCDAAHQALIDAFSRSRTADERMKLAVAVQESAYKMVPYVPFGQWFQPVAHSAQLKGLLAVPGVMTFWNVEKVAK
ncbi:MAG: ABC transporter substrate-binding protein [Bosea sp. (in: a-proteobacteria)]